MNHVIPLDHKQIAYVSYDPEERSLVVAYHKGASSRHFSIDMEQFQQLLQSSNKVDVLSKLLSRPSGSSASLTTSGPMRKSANSGYTG